ncbi:glycerophosphodiester phosphodiesterase [Desulfopila inferna]|uniref:glycerophosphodiester phosphodiesterase n=1 Tax=Desulfopila inferna TaxID=468528 RepID=UPI0019653F5C|nr:glycerophosphodiester phosphodiesterase family protein [Desulfopila inferna]
MTLVVGCTMPSSIVNLEKILERQEISPSDYYGYRCTAGAHRGASVDFRENTLAALQAADRDSRYAFIEFDVQYSKDRKIVVYHDKRLLRLFGNPREIGETTFAELLEITEGNITTFDSVIVLLKKKLNIEIKSQGDLEEDRQLVDEIMKDIRVLKRENDIMISSISSEVIQYVKQKYPNVPTGQVYWLTASTYLHLDGLTKNLYRELNTAKADYIMLHTANLRNIDDLLAFKPKGKTIVFWDFDDTMYIVHKDFSDRLWGESSVTAFYQFLQYGLFSLLQWPDLGSRQV